VRRFGENWQPVLYTILIVLGLALAYLIAFVIKNSDETSVDFVFFTATASLVWVILISLALGLVAGVLLSQLYRRGQRDELREPRHAVADLGRPDEAVGEPQREGAADTAREEI
jgi:uncharacterized integral membrane protein